MNILKELQREVQKRVRVANPLEDIEFKHFFRHNNDRILWFTQATNETNAVVTNPNLKYYQMPFEPDGDKLRVWLRFNDVAGASAKDWSGFENNAVIVGSPTKQEGHVVNMNSLSFDGTSQSYVRIPHKPDSTSISVLTEGFSISVWVKPTRIDLHGGKPRVIACHIDDDFTTQGRTWSLWVEPDGTLFFVVETGNTTYVRRAVNAMPVMNEWYHIVATFDVSPSNAIPPLHVNSIEYTSNAATFNDKVPWVPVSSSTNLDTIVGGTDESGASKWAGAIADYRYFKDMVYTHANAVVQYSNKYTISDIVYVALVGVATTAFEDIAGGQTPPAPGETPPPPPPPSTVASFSSISFSPISFNVERGSTIAGGGGGGAAVTIPDQFFDDFSLEPVYTLTTLNQNSPDSKWTVRDAPGGTGFIRTEDYTHPGDRARRVLRMRASTTPVSPLIALNGDRFYDVYIKSFMRVISQVNTSTTSNTAWLIFKYVDNSNYYYVELRADGARVAKVVAGVTTVLGTQSNPTSGILYPIGSIHEVVVETRADGMEIYVWVDGVTTPDISITGVVNPPDAVITALGRIGFRATNCEMIADHILARPILGDTFQGSTWTATVVGNKSTNLKWETVVAGNGTGNTVRTFDQGTFSAGGRVLNLNSGTGATTQPIVLSTNSYRGIDAAVRMATLSQNTVATNNRAEFIFKYVNSTNYYWIQLLTTGWVLKRKIGNVDTTLLTDATPTFADNPAYPYHLVRVQVYNAGRDVVIRLGNSGTIEYEEHSEPDGFYTDDGGILASSGRIGFRAPLCNAVFDNFWCRMV